MLGSFFAFDPSLRSGVSVGTDSLASDVNRDEIPDIVVGTGPGVASEVKVFSGADGSVLKDFAPFASAMTSGVTVATAYADDDSYADVVVGTGPGVATEIKVFSGASGKLVDLPTGDFFPFGPDDFGGVNLAASNDPPAPTVSVTASPNPTTTGSGVFVSGMVSSTPSMTRIEMTFDWGDMATSKSNYDLPASSNITTYLVASPTQSYSSAGTYTVTTTALVTYSGGSGTGSGSSTSMVTVTSGGGGTGSASVWLSPSSQNLAEGGSGHVYVERSGGDTSSALTVNVGIGSDGSADPLATWDTDYSISASGSSLLSTGGTVTFGAGVTKVDLGVATATDSFLEGTEGFRVTVQSGSGYTPGSGGSTTADVRITDKPPIAISASPNPANAGQSVTVTATLGPIPMGVSAPTGTITFFDGSTSIGTGSLSTSGTSAVATYSTSSLAAGTHSLSASYGGDSTYGASSSPSLSETINPVATTTTVTTSGTPSVYGSSVTFTSSVSVSGGGTATGTVTFRDGSTVLGTGTLSGGSTAITTTGVNAGSRTITASYSGSSIFASSGGSVSQTVTAASISVAAVSKSKSYGAADPAFTYTYSGLVNGDSSSAFSGSLSRASGATLGTYAITQGTLSAGSNYSISYTSANLTITAASLSITASNVSMTYANGTTLNGTSGFTTSGLVGTDAVSSVSLASNASPSGSGNWSVGSWTITPSSASGSGLSNYTIAYYTGTVTVSAKGLTLSGFAVSSRQYDGTTTATITSNGTLSGSISGDSVTLNASGRSASFANANAGVEKLVAAAGYALTGTDASNYTLTQPTTTATITGSPLTVSGVIANNKVYDSTTAATLSTSSATFSGVFSGDSVSLASGATGTFASRNVGTAISVTASGLSLTGAQAGNYSLTLPTGLTANITDAFRQAAGSGSK